MKYPSCDDIIKKLNQSISTKFATNILNRLTIGTRELILKINHLFGQQLKKFGNLINLAPRVPHDLTLTASLSNYLFELYVFKNVFTAFLLLLSYIDYTIL